MILYIYYLGCAFHSLCGWYEYIFPVERCYLENLANDILSELMKWSTINSLAINALKTKAVVFTPPQKCINQDITLHLGSDNIQLSNEVKTLGVIFNKHLNWDDHIERTAGALARTCGILGKFRQVLPSKIKLLIYHAIFSSHLSYCHLVWGTTSRTIIYKLSVLQKIIIRLIAIVPYDAQMILQS